MTGLVLEFYSKPNCVQCTASERRIEKNSLEEKGLEIKRLSAEENLDLLKSEGFSTAPGFRLFRNGEKVATWSGFRPEFLREDYLSSMAA